MKTFEKQIQLYIHRFDRDNMEGAYWTEHVVSSRSDITPEWRHIPSEEKTVLDWSDSSDIESQYPSALIFAAGHRLL